MNFFVWVLVGAIVGGAASTFIGTRDWQRFTRNVAVGIAGFVLGGSLVSELSGSSSFQGGEFGLEGMFVSLLGTTLLLAAVHLVSDSRRRLAKAGHDVTAARTPTRWTRYQSKGTEMGKTIRMGRALRPLITAGLACVAIFFVSCATPPLVPDSAMDAAKVAISNAEKAQAGQFASAELGEAREKLALADNAVRDEKMVAAERFAQESQVQAELASARTAAAKAAAVNKEMERGADALTEEMKRSGESK